MTVFAGVFALSREKSIPGGVANQLRSLISRHRDDRPVEFVGDRMALFKVDIGAYKSPAHEIAGTDVCMVAGDPLLIDEEIGSGRYASVKRIHDELRREKVDALRLATGTFCGACYTGETNRLVLFGDKLGLRQLYIWEGPDYLVFATSLRILEQLDLVVKEFDVRGVTETAAFGYPLGNRTQYKGIDAIRAGEIRTFGDVRKTSSYWDWARIANEPCESGDSAPHAWEQFAEGVRRRVGSDRNVIAFLSGGLDSRAIVGTLKSLALDLATFNFAPTETQDQVFAAAVAEHLQIRHTEGPVNAAVVEDLYRTELTREWISGLARGGPNLEHPMLIWSGDGGSVGLGHVYLTERMIDLARTSGDEKAIDEFFSHNRWGLPSRLFSRRVRESLIDLPKAGMREELAALPCNDRGKALYLFLMLNDQRRHLQKHFENIDLNRLEFHLPFFDAALLEVVMRTPIDECVGHKFYMRWLEQCPVPLTSVPWQAYPGHVQCPLPVPDTLRLQWGNSGYYDAETSRLAHHRELKRSWKMITSLIFPSAILSRGRLTAITLLTIAKLDNYVYAMKTASIFFRYWQSSEQDRKKRRREPRVRMNEMPL